MSWMLSSSPRPAMEGGERKYEKQVAIDRAEAEHRLPECLKRSVGPQPGGGTVLVFRLSSPCIDDGVE